MHLLHIHSFHSYWQGSYLYAFTAYIYFSQTLAVYMLLLAIYTFYSYWQFIHSTDTSCLYSFVCVCWLPDKRLSLPHCPII